MSRSEFSTQTFESGTRLTWKHRNGSLTEINLAQGHAIAQFTEVSGAKHTVQLTSEMMAALVEQYHLSTSHS